jgi:hypothetical protein
VKRWFPAIIEPFIGDLDDRRERGNQDYFSCNVSAVEKTLYENNGG